MNMDRLKEEAALLVVLAECWPNPKPFDASEISNAIQRRQHPALLVALGFLNPRVLKRNGHLSRGTISALDKWLWKLDCRERGGIMLQRDRYGWCRVHRSAC